METYEVVIIGAGPAGLSCAHKLSQLNSAQLGEKGEKVLLLEQNSVIGPKVCAGGLASDVIGYCQFPDELIDHKFDKITFHTPWQHRALDLGSPFYTVDRKNLGQWQLKKLADTKVEVRTNARVSKIEPGYVVVNGEKIFYKYLVGADGSNSATRRFVGLRTNELIVAIQYIIPTDEFKKTEIFFDPGSISLGYIWIFPHKGYVSIGCGCEPKFFSSQKLAEGFKKWLAKNKIDVSKGKFEAFTINFDYQGYKFGNVFLAGDAAGLAAGLTGGGVFQAYVSGEEIAKTIADKDYVSKKMDEVLEGNRKQNDALRFLEKTKSFIRLETELFLFLLRNEKIGQRIMRRMM